MKPTLEISGIKCDSCDYRNPDIVFNDYDNWLNKPCPKCGENLLTQADYDTVQVLSHMVEFSNFNESIDSNEPIIEVDISMNGSGDLTISNLKIIKSKILKEVIDMKTLTTRDLIRAINEDKDMVMLGRITDIDEFLIFITTTDGEDLVIDEDQVTHNFGDVEDTEAFLAANPEYTIY